MATPNELGGAGDAHNLNRFLLAQEVDYEQAFSELQNGRKLSHWIWYIFPQFGGLGFSARSQLYAIKSVQEAVSYLEHPILGPRLFACAEVTLRIEGRSALEIFGPIDALKLQSSATLFACVAPAGSVFERLIEKYFQGQRDGKTLSLVSASPK